MLVNYERARNLMQERGMQALIASSPENFFYCSDLYMPFVDRFRGLSGGFGMFVLIPLDGEPVLCVSALDADLARKTSWIQDQRYSRTWAYIRRKDEIKVYDNPIAVLSEVMQEKGLETGKVGIEEKVLPYGDFRLISAKLPKTTFIDASKTFLEIRSVKTREEISRIKIATELTEKAFGAAFRIAKVGVTEADLLRAFQLDIIKNGGYIHQGIIHSNLTAGKESATIRRSWPLELKLKNGDIMRFDGGTIYKGYRSDMARCRVIGSPSEKAKRLYAAVKTAQERIVDSIKPGVKLSDLFHMGLSTVREMGYPDFQRSHFGHGLGLITEEEPLVSANSDVVIEKDMVLCIEVPYYWVGFGGLTVEDVVRVTTSGHQVLSPLLHRELQN